MNCMFENAIVFNQDISGWDVSTVQIINTMFKNATVFNQDLSGWNVSNVNSSRHFDFNTTGLITEPTWP